MFFTSHLGDIALSLNRFLDLGDQEQIILRQFNSNNLRFVQWAEAVLPPTRKEEFQKEVTEIHDKEVLGDTIEINSYPLHKTLKNLLPKMPITEAAVERTFNRHKLFHNKLRASLGNEKLDDQLYIRYNFEKIMKIAAREQSSNVNLETEIISWAYECDEN